MGDETLIRIEGLTKSFGSRVVLRGVDLSIPRGCLYGLIGPGASGKSVLLKLVTGLLRPDQGRVPYWTPEHARRGSSREVDVEAIVNGQVVRTSPIVAEAPTIALHHLPGFDRL